MKTISSRKKGFTLIELLVVISIIGLLSSIVLASLNTARSKARNVSRVQSIAQLRNAFALVQNGGTLPSSSGAWTCVSVTCPWGFAHNATVDAALAPYMKFPTDPTGGKTYYGFLYLGPYDSVLDPYPAATGGYFLHWSEERMPLTSTTCAPGLVMPNSNNPSVYPNDIFCSLKLNQ